MVLLKSDEDQRRSPTVNTNINEAPCIPHQRAQPVFVSIIWIYFSDGGRTPFNTGGIAGGGEEHDAVCSARPRSLVRHGSADVRRDFSW